MKEKIKKISNITTLAIIFIGIMVAMVFSVTIFIGNKRNVREQEKKNNSLTDAESFKAEYEKFNDGVYLEMEISPNNIITYTSYNKINDILDGGTGIIYLGYADSQECRNIVPTLFQVAENTGITKIHYLNIKDDLTKKPSDYLNLSLKLKQDIIAPTVIFVKDGKIIGIHLGSVDSFEGDTLNKEQRKELYNIYISYAEIVSGNNCDESC